MPMILLSTIISMLILPMLIAIGIRLSKNETLYGITLGLYFLIIGILTILLLFDLY